MNTLTVKEFAERVGVSAGRIRQLVVQKRIKAEKRGIQLFIPESELPKFESIKMKGGWPQGKPRKRTNPGAVK